MIELIHIAYAHVLYSNRVNYHGTVSSLCSHFHVVLFQERVYHVTIPGTFVEVSALEQQLRSLLCVHT